MRRVVGAFVCLCGLLVLAVVLLPERRHGHLGEPLAVVVRIEAGGRPLDGGRVATARSRFWLEDFDRHVADALSDPPEPRRNHGVCTAAVAREGPTTIASSVYVTRYFRGSRQVRQELLLPEFLVVDHPRLGRRVVPIDRDAGVIQDADGAWRVDLGTVDVGE